VAQMITLGTCNLRILISLEIQGFICIHTHLK
jgi:hypothetical protein